MTDKSMCPSLDDVDRRLCLHQIIGNWALRTPDSVAVVFGDRTLTYAELNQRAEGLAQRLRREGIGVGSLVGISMKRSFEMVVALVAILKAGAAYVPLDPRLPKERLLFLVSDAALRLVLTNGMSMDAGGAHVIDVAKDQDANVVSVEGVHCQSEATNNDLVYVIYTSGSTGEPKGVMVPHCGVVNWLVWMRKVFAVTPDDAVLKKAPLTFDVSAWELFLPLISGARLVLADSDRQYDQRYLAALMASTRVTIAQFVPSLLRAFLEQKTLPDLSALRHVMCGGEILSPKLAALFQERLTAELCNSYGPTEASIGVTRWICRPNEQRDSVPIGYAIDNTELYILDADLKPVPPGVTGELYIAGICLARGYLNRPDLTAERFLPNPLSSEIDARMYRTGDLCRFLDDGSIDFLGRSDDQVKVRGVRIELPEVEKALATHESVEAAATTVEKPGEDATLVAYVVPAPGKALSDQELRRFLRRKLPLSMVPSSFYFVTSLPVSANGKLDRKALRVHQDMPAVVEAPRVEIDEISKRLSAIWAELLRRDDFGFEDDFFDCGADSFSAMQLYLRIEEEFGQSTLNLVNPLIDPLTIASLAQRLRSLSSNVNESAAKPSPSISARDTDQWIGPLRCRPAHLNDVEGIWRVCSRAFPSYSNSSLQEFAALCRHRWLNNPCRTDDDPFGWVLETKAGQIVGFHGLVPTRLWIGGKSISAVAPTTWAAEPGYSGGGLALLTTYLDWGSKRFLVNTTANAITSSMHEHGNRGMLKIPIKDFDQRFLWVLDFKAILRWKFGGHAGHSILRDATASLLTSSIASSVAPFAFGILGGARAAMRTGFGRSRIRFSCKSLSVEPIEHFGEEFDALWERLKKKFDVTTERTAEVLNWRHINPPRLLGTSHVLCCKDQGELVGYVALREPATTAPGHFIVTDLFYDPARHDVLHNLLNAAFDYAAARSATAFEVFGLHSSVNRELLTQNPFVLRRAQLEQLGRGSSLGGILAALLHRRSHARSSYWYRAPSSDLEAICATGSWWPSGIDGDLNL